LAVHTEDLADGSYVSAAAPVTPKTHSEDEERVTTGSFRSESVTEDVEWGRSVA
jgi:hypothetical protein